MMHFFLQMVVPDPLYFGPGKGTLQYERDYCNDNEDYYKPFRDFYRETGDPFCSRIKNTRASTRKITAR